MAELSPPKRPTRSSIIAILIASLVALGIGSAALAHDEIESSVPEHQAQLDEPIDEVTVNFGQPVDGIEMALVAPDDTELPSTVEVLSGTQAKLLFDPVTEKGQYIVRYLAEEEGHLISGAITFTYGDASGGAMSAGIWIGLAVVAVLILGIGAWMSYRRSQQFAAADAKK